MRFLTLATAFVWAVVALMARYAWSESLSSHFQTCLQITDQMTVIRCALEHDLNLQRQRQELARLVGRKMTASTWLPSHPVVTLAAAYRSNGVQRDVNAYVTLAQEIELAGQRGTRVQQVDAEILAQLRRVAVTEQEVIAQALFAYNDRLAAQLEKSLADQLDALAKTLRQFTQSRLEQQLLSKFDSHLALAEATRWSRLRPEAERHEEVAAAVWMALIPSGTPEVPRISGTLKPWPTNIGDTQALVEKAWQLRGEMSAAAAELEVAKRRVTALKRERIPNLTLSAFVHRDGFAEQVVGGQLSFPLFLPGPVGPSQRGAIHEAMAQTQQVELDQEAIRRQVRLEVMRALANVMSWQREYELFAPTLIEKAQQDLQGLHRHLTQGNIPVREALFSAQTLIDFLQDELKVRQAYTNATIEFYRAVGLSFQGHLP